MELIEYNRNRRQRGLNITGILKYMEYFGAEAEIIVFNIIVNPCSAGIFVYKPWRPKGYF